jgi:UDP-glucuronate decarboxylase
MGRHFEIRRAVVAGAAGFIGSHLCDALIRRQISVIGIDNLQSGRLENIQHLQGTANFRFIHADVIDALPQSLRADIIFNLACAASPPHYQSDPVHTLMTSVVGTHNLLSLAADLGARFVFASTSEIYGDPLSHPQTEKYNGNVNPTGPRACYDEGKRAAETLCFDYLRAGRVDTRVCRIFNTYGPRMRADDGRVVSNVITQALEGREISIYGDGTQTRSFCYLDDLIAGLLALGLKDVPVPGPINLGNPNEISVGDLVKTVLELTNSRSPLVNYPLPVDDPRRRKPDIALAKELLGWAPKVTLRKGLAKTISWFASTRPLWHREPTILIERKRRTLNGGPESIRLNSV